MVVERAKHSGGDGQGAKHHTRRIVSGRGTAHVSKAEGRSSPRAGLARTSSGDHGDLDSSVLLCLEEEVRGVRGLYVGIMVRAIEDWLLYRDSPNDDERELARDAYEWIFEEDPEDLDDDDVDQSFLRICELIGKDPEDIRESVYRLRAADVLCTGRPAVHKSTKDPREKDILDDEFL